MRAQGKVFIGGTLGTAIPSNIGQKQYGVGFADVAVAGPRVGLNGIWFYNKRLSLGGEIATSHLGKDPVFWNVQRYGNVEASYNLLQLTASGAYYFDDKGFRPYVGIGFGGYLLANRLDFKSAYAGTDADASVEFRTNVIKPGFAPQVGFLTKISKYAFFYADMKFQVIPNVKAETVYIYDENGYAVDMVTENVHGHQNHWTIVVGVLGRLR